MKDLVAKLLRLKTPLKVAVTVGAMVVVSAIYYFLFYLDLSDQIASQQARRQQLQTEREGYEKRKKEYLAYRNELKQLEEEQRELLKALPRRTDIGSFLASIQDQIELSGLEMLEFKPDAEVPDELYVKIPVRMEVRGTYHGITRFFKNVGELSRIVNVEGLALVLDKTAAEGGGDSLAPPKLRAKFTVATFRFQDQPPAGAGGGT